MSTTALVPNVVMRGPNGGGLKDAICTRRMSEGSVSFWCPFCDNQIPGTAEQPPTAGTQCSCGAHVVEVKMIARPVRTPGTGEQPDAEPGRHCAVCKGFVLSSDQSERMFDGQPIHATCGGVVLPLVDRIEALEQELAASRRAYEELMRQRGTVMADVDATVDALRQQLAECDRTIEQMRAANEAHQNLLEEERRAASQARRLAALRRRRVAELERRLRSAEERADHWERRADRLGRLALEALCPQARIDDRQPEDRIGVGSVTLDGAALLRTSAALS